MTFFQVPTIINKRQPHVFGTVGPSCEVHGSNCFWRVFAFFTFVKLNDLTDIYRFFDAISIP